MSEYDDQAESQPAGTVVDALGMRTTVRPGELVSGGVLLLKIVEPNGDVRLSTWWSDGFSWLEKAGILRVAERVSSTASDFEEEE